MQRLPPPAIATRETNGEAPNNLHHSATQASTSGGCALLTVDWRNQVPEAKIRGQQGRSSPPHPKVRQTQEGRM